MIPSFLSTLALSSLILPSLAFDADSKENVAVYWGQSSAGSEESLADYCASSDADIFLLAFLDAFPDMDLNLSSACSSMDECTQVANDIKTCQDAGKIVMLSLGGSVGDYGFTGDDEAEDFAQTLWDTFGGGSSTDRPFGDSIVDGFDFDIENNNPEGYAALVTSLRSLFESANKTYYISAAPQCPYPDASVGDLLSGADVDFAFIQFYNNYCSISGEFNWDTWVQFAEDTSPNKDIKLFLGLPGSSTAAGSGYVGDISTLQSTIAGIYNGSNFGGVALWDASQAFSNEVDGETYAAQVKNALDLAASSSSTGVASSSATSSSSVASSSSTATSSSVAPSSSAPSSSPVSISSVLISSTVPSSYTALTSQTSSSTSTPATSSSAANSSAPAASSSAAVSVLPTSSAVPTTQNVWSSSAPAASSSAAVSILPTSSAVPTTQNVWSSSAPATPVSTTSTGVSTSTLASSSSTTSGSTAQAPTSAPSSTARSTSTLTPSSSASSNSAHASAVSLNKQYAAGMTNQGSCNSGDIACTEDSSLAICDYGSWVAMECAAGTSCYAYDSDGSVFTGCNFSSLKENFFS